VNYDGLKPTKVHSDEHFSHEFKPNTAVVNKGVTLPRISISH